MLFQKRSALPPWRKSRPAAGEKKLFLIIVSVLGCPKGVGGLTFNFLWNDPINFLDWSMFKGDYRLNLIIILLSKSFQVI
jgi:hypothetical protein